MAEDSFVFGYQMYEGGRLVEASQLRAPSLALAEAQISAMCQARQDPEATTPEVTGRVWELKATCVVCGDWVPASTRCSNGRCPHCHLLHCSSGDDASPGHYPINLGRVDATRTAADLHNTLTRDEQDVEEAMRRLGCAVFDVARADGRFRSRLIERSTALAVAFARSESAEAERDATTEAYAAWFEMHTWRPAS